MLVHQSVSFMFCYQHWKRSFFVSLKLGQENPSKILQDTEDSWDDRVPGESWRIQKNQQYGPSHVTIPIFSGLIYQTLSGCWWLNPSEKYM